MNILKNIMLTVFVLLLNFSLTNSSFAKECGNCPPVGEKAVKIIDAFAKALQDPGNNFVLLRVLTAAESRIILRSGVVDLDKLVEKVISGYRFDLFENLDKGVGSSKILMRLNRPQATKPTRDNPDGISFIPKPGTSWILIIPSTNNDLPNVITDNKKLAPVGFYDEFYGVMPADKSAGWVGDAMSVYEDLKKIKLSFQSAKEGKIPELKSDIGREVLRVALKNLNGLENVSGVSP